MKKIIIITILISTCGFAYSGQPLTQEQLESVFTSLKSQTRDAWIPSGTIEGTHLVIKPETDEVTKTKEKIKYDGERFRWEVDIEAYEDLQQMPKKSDDIENNTKRIFVWDGNEYTMYFKSGKNAIVMEDTSDTPVNVNGPLKAGIVPWGYGIYSSKKLQEALVSAEYDKDGHVKMSMQKDTEYSLEMVLDPAKDYAVLSRVYIRPGKTEILDSYSDYNKHGNCWIPSTIIMDKINYKPDSTSEHIAEAWQITSVDSAPCTEDQFTASYDDNTRVECRLPERVISYRNKIGRNTEYMLQHRKYNISLGNRSDRNCATAAMTYILSCLGKDIKSDDFDGLVTGSDKSTSLFELDKLAKRKELNSLAVQTSLAELAGLDGCYIILHMPKAKHYVILDHIDDKYVWLIDLDSDKFYYRLDVEKFQKDWSNRTALIISNKAITAPAESAEIPQERLHQIKGSTGGFGTYSCTDLIQEYHVKLCSEYMGMCGSDYIIWYNRYGCEVNGEGGYCSGDKLVGSISTDCIDDPVNPGSCTSLGIWNSYYLHSCK